MAGLGTSTPLAEPTASSMESPPRAEALSGTSIGYSPVRHAVQKPVRGEPVSRGST